MAHALDGLALMPFWDGRADEGEGHGVETISEHLVDVIDEFARDAILIGGQSNAELRHGPINRGPM